MSELYIGLMSGTSLDGADGVLVDFSGAKLRVLASATEAFSNEFRAELLALNSPSPNELHRAALAANQLAGVYANVVEALILGSGVAVKDIKAIGAHGQTVRHQPALGYTTQLNNPALLAERTGIDVVADFRSRDVAAGGQGAPLVPAFHQSVFGQRDQTTLVLNIGGISNLSVLPPKGSATGQVLGYDCGPGNALMDAWCSQHTGKPYDDNGLWAASGKLIPELLASLLDEPYLSLPPPKSTGRDLFNDDWLKQHILYPHCRPQDIARTIVELSAYTICQALTKYCPDVDEVYLCGGGARNTLLINTLKAMLKDSPVLDTDVLGVGVDWLEAVAFAWLAKQTLENKPSNLPAVTGAKGLRVLGAIYPA